MNVRFKWIGGATFILWVGNLKIAVDPVLCPEGTIQDYGWFKSKRLQAPSYDNDDFKNIDIWFITHSHEDHLDKHGKTKIADTSQIVCDGKTARQLTTEGKTNIRVLNWFEKCRFTIRHNHITVEAIPAIHGINPVTALLAGKVNGYFLTFENENQRIAVYITSDTVWKRKLIKALNGRHVDILIPNMGAAKQGSWIMTLTLSAKMLQKLIRLLTPQYTIPVHFAAFQHYVEPVEKIKALNEPSLRIFRPGETATLKVGEGE